MTVLEKQCPYVENKNMSTAIPMRYTRISCENKLTLRENNQGMVLALHEKYIKGVLKTKEVVGKRPS